MNKKRPANGEKPVASEERGEPAADEGRQAFSASEPAALQEPPQGEGAKRLDFHLRLNIANKFFLILLSLLTINLVVTAVFGSTMMEQFYLTKKEQEIVESAKAISENLDKPEPLWEGIYNAEQKNIDVLVFYGSYNAETGMTVYSPPVYFSRSDTEMMGQRYDATLRISNAINNGIMRRLENEPVVVQVDDISKNNGRIRLYQKMDGDSYLFMETPLGYIKTTSELAAQFMLLLCLATLVLGGIASFAVARLIARPIKQIDEVAKKLTVMDFSQRCEVQSHDEVGQLSESINYMADRLRENIDLLNQRNALLQRDLEREEGTNRQRRDFIANVSHDFKTPLALIAAYAETLGEGADPETAACCGTIVEQANRINVMVNRLLSLSRLESGMITLKPTLFSLADAFYAVLTDLRILLEKNGMDWEVQSNCSDCFVQADYQYILQVITNLIENAVKYADARKQLRIRFARRENRLRATVFNTAEPIPPEVLEHLFEGFYRADTARGQQSNSYGLGLAIVQAVVERHGCACGAENVEDGVAFWFELPYVELDEQEEESEELEDGAAEQDGTEGETK